MFRIAISYFLTVLMLLMNIQAAVGEASEAFHLEGESHPLSVHSHHESDDEHEADSHCQHCCHAHASTLIVQQEAALGCLSNEISSRYSIIRGGLPSGPPTPPPNA